MDIDNIPFGTDFRSHIRETLQEAGVLIAVIGRNWLGADAAGNARIQEKTDPVRVEIETAIEHHTPIIPILVEGAKMPQSVELPPGFGNFAFLNAPEIASGRDFRPHMNRLIGAIDRILSPGADVKTSATKPWRVDVLRYFLVPLVLLLVAHHVVVNALDLNPEYLQIACALVPFVFGFAFFWVGGRGMGPACIFAIALGVVGAAAMTVSLSLSSGDPLMPQTRFEWWDNIHFAVIITLSFVAGNVMTGALCAMLKRKFWKP
jgi:hypothetical protein